MFTRPLILRLNLLATFLIAAGIGRAEVVMTTLPDQAGFKVTSGAYRATLNATGAMTSLVVSGEEFLAQQGPLHDGVQNWWQVISTSGSGVMGWVEEASLELVGTRAA